MLAFSRSMPPRSKSKKRKTPTAARKPRQPRRGSPGVRTSAIERKEAFAREWVIDGNGTRAATAVGYSAKTAAAQATRLLKDVNVIAHVAQLRADAAKRAAVTKDRITRELAQIAFSDIGDVFRTDPVTKMPTLRPIEEWPQSARQAISRVKTKHYDPITNKDGDIVAEGYTAVEIAFYDKPTALIKLGADLGMFSQNRRQHAHDRPLENLTPEERLQKIRDVLDAARRRRDGVESEQAPERAQ
jgi:phage terminase small subunit